MQVDNRMLSLAHRMADSAGDILRRAFRADMAVENKEDASPVTAADREVETMLRKLIEAVYPDHGIIGEEFGNIRTSSPFQWVIDPIDGTHAFIAGQPTFTTLIALAKDGVPILGVIDQPISKERWLGVMGEATTRNGAPAHTSRCASLAKAAIATTSTNYFTPEQATSFERLKRACGHVTLGGDAYLYAGLASGKMDIVVDAGLKPYDFCALKPVVEGAGGIITDWNGKPLNVASDGRVIAAANEELHKAALHLLQRD